MTWHTLEVNTEIDISGYHFYWDDDLIKYKTILIWIWLIIDLMMIWFWKKSIIIQFCLFTYCFFTNFFFSNIHYWNKGVSCESFRMLDLILFSKYPGLQGSLSKSFSNHLKCKYDKIPLLVITYHIQFEFDWLHFCLSGVVFLDKVGYSHSHVCVDSVPVNSSSKPAPPKSITI